MKKYLLIFAIFLFPSFTYTQQSVVAETKRELGFTSNLTSQQLYVLLTKVATKVGGGLLVKTVGNNCNGYSCDVICFSNGDAFDVLSDSEGAATPTWNFIGKVPSCELVKQTPEEPKPEEPKEEPSSDVRTLLLAILGKLNTIEQNQNAQTEALLKVMQELKAEVAKGIKVRF
jgi:hypothetical protein